jgi:hypothetical protein
MPTKAVIIVPSQGNHASMFEGVAKAVDRKVYGGKAIVLRATVAKAADGTLGVTFSKVNGKPFSWDDVSNLTSIVTISHGGGCDGPNLNYGSGGDNQPWGAEACDEAIAEGGRAFWGAMAAELKATGKIILVGCYMGSGSYAQGVANVTGRSVYASDGLFAAANSATTEKHVKAIEKGTVISPMKRFKPKPTPTP